MVIFRWVSPNSFRGGHFTNRLQWAMALQGHLKTFKLRPAKKTHDAPMERFCKVYSHNERASLERGTWQKSPSKNQVYRSVCCTSLQRCLEHFHGSSRFKIMIALGYGPHKRSEVFQAMALWHMAKEKRLFLLLALCCGWSKPCGNSLY